MRTTRALLGQVQSRRGLAVRERGLVGMLGAARGTRDPGMVVFFRNAARARRCRDNRADNQKGCHPGGDHHREHVAPHSNQPYHHHGTLRRRRHTVSPPLTTSSLAVPRNSSRGFLRVRLSRLAHPRQFRQILPVRGPTARRGRPSIDDRKVAGPTATARPIRRRLTPESPRPPAVGTPREYPLRRYSRSSAG